MISHHSLITYACNFTYLFESIIGGHYPSSINLVWILTDWLPFLILENSGLKFYMQHLSSKLRKIFTCNWIRVFRIITGGQYPKPITLAWILMELWSFLNLCGIIIEGHLFKAHNSLAFWLKYGPFLKTFFYFKHRYTYNISCTLLYLINEIFLILLILTLSRLLYIFYYEKHWQ
jgi:hypothetical protein